ncbi:hypothetical protein [Clostridium intestinale]|uniref:hypothetical protein n=1 Tax=Clostridium intestinale TaxID=36845 RepID=UPI0028E977D7|nr:hypothetical protein [Clostridium intestinale]
MLEQKLFFTRNGEYTLWEKLQEISVGKLEIIKAYISDELRVDMKGYENASTESFIYNCYRIVDVEQKYLLDKHINQFFEEDKGVGTDFNGTLYKMDLSYMNAEIIYNLLEKLEEKVDIFDIEGLKISRFNREEENCVDIRVSSTKKIDYKENTNDRLINTEVRIYIDLGLMVMTDYSDYTHAKSVKSMLVQEIRYIILNQNGVLEPYTLSDMALRVLLKRSKKYASKFKFAVGDYMSLDCNILENVTEDPLLISGLKEIYDKHKMFEIKVSMSANEEKYITIDGERGKLSSRSKCIEISDINEFVILISEVVKYDYLNSNYIKQSKDIAKRVLVGPTTSKISQVDGIYSIIYESITGILASKVDIDNISLTINAFFYSLLKKIEVSEDITSEYEIDTITLQTIKKMFGIDSVKVNKLYNKLIETALSQDSDVLIAELDKFIKQYGEEYVNSI